MLIIKEKERTQFIILRSQEEKLKSILENYKQPLKIAKNENKIIVVSYEEFFETIMMKEFPEYEIKTTEDLNLSNIKVHIPTKQIILNNEKERVPYIQNVKLTKSPYYSSMTPAEALEKDGFLALVRLLHQLPLLDNNVYKRTIKAIEVCTKEWVDRNLRVIENSDIKNMPIDVIKDAIVKSEILIPDYIHYIVDSMTYSSVDDFLANASEDIIRGAYAGIIKQIIRKVDQI